MKSVQLLLDLVRCMLHQADLIFTRGFRACHGLCLGAGQTQSDGPEGVQAEVVAHVKNSVRFSGMADFQYVSCDTRPKDAQVQALFMLT